MPLPYAHHWARGTVLVNGLSGVFCRSQAMYAHDFCNDPGHICKYPFVTMNIPIDGLHQIWPLHPGRTYHSDSVF